MFVTRAIKRKLSFWSRQGVRSDSFFSTHGTTEEIDQYTLKMAKKYGRVYGGYALTYDFLVINEPELIKEVFVKNFDVFPSHQHMNMGPSPKVNRMLFFMDGDEDWKRIRSIITPAFTSSKLKAMMGHVFEITDQLMTTLEDLEKKGIKHF